VHHQTGSPHAHARYLGADRPPDASPPARHDCHVRVRHEGWEENAATRPGLWVHAANSRCTVRRPIAGEHLLSQSLTT